MMFLAMMQGTAQAELLAYEGFDYTSGQGLSGQGGSSDGWSGAWSGGASNVEAPGMTYSGLPSSGNRVGPTATFNSNLRNLDVNGAFAAFQEVNSDGDDVIGKDGTSIWLSMLWKSAGYGRGWSLGLRDDLLGGAGAAVNIGTKTNIVNSPLALFNSDLSTVVNLSAATSSTEFLLAEVIFGAGDNDTLNLYRNEDPTADPSTFVVDATISGFDMGFYGVVIKTGPAHTFGIDEMDEIRIGETVNDVLGITAAIWDGGGGAGVTNWGTSSNWNSDTDPGLVEVQFASAGTAATMDVSDTVKSVTFNRAGNFDIAAGGGTLTINEGITTTTANQFGIAAPVTLGASQSFDVFSGSTLTISGAIGDGGNGYAITKTSAGTLVLSGANTYTGGTTVTAGTLAGTTTSLQGAVTNNAAVVFDQAGSGTYAGDMGGSGTLTKLGAGNVTLSGTNTYSGGTTVTTGTLTGTTTSLQGAVTNNAVVVFDQAATGTYAGIMSGTGTLIKTGAGTLTLSSTNTYSGGTTVTAGTLSGTSSSLQGAITNNAAVAFDQSADGTYADIISGSGTLTKTGAGRLTVSGNNTYTGTTTLSAGTLNLTGQLFGDVVVNGGTFMGTGTIANSGDLTLNSGSTFAPGASIGTTNIAGNYVQNSGSTLEVEVLKNADNSLSSDLIDVTGTANLASGSTINVTDLTPTDRFILTGDTFTIITTGGGVTDNGTAVTDTSAVLSFAGSISGNDYILTATRSPFASSATGKNNSSLLGAVDSDMSSTSFTSDVTLINALSSLSAAQLNNAAEQLSPQTYASPATLSTNTSRRLSSNLSGHLGARRSNNTHWAKPGSLSSDNDLLLADASGNPELLGYVIRETEKRRQQVGTTQETGYLFLPFGTFYNQDSTDNVIGFSAKAVGIHFGYDYHFSDHLILGLGGAYAHSFIKNDYDLGKANVDSFRLGPYGTYFKDKWFVDGSVTFGYHHNKTRRNIRFGGVDRTAHGEYDAYDIHTFLKAGRDFDRGGWTLTPFASLAYTYYRSENFEESEADSAGLNVDARTQQSLLGKLGFHLHRVSTLAHMKIIPEVFVGCTHQFIDENDINARFMNGVTKFSTDVDRDRDDSVYYGAGLSSLLSENISAFVRYEGEHYAGGKANTVDLGLTARF